MPPVNKPTLSKSFLGNTHLYHCLREGEIHVVFGRFETTFEFSPYVNGIIPRFVKEGDPYKVHSATVRNSGRRIEADVRLDKPTSGHDSKRYGSKEKAGKADQNVLGRALKEFEGLIDEIVPPVNRDQARRTCSTVLAARIIDNMDREY